MRSLGLVILLLSLALPARAQETPKQATLYKSPDCTCCEGHARYLKRNGIQVTIIESPDLSAVKKAHGVPPEFEGCHTILFDGYVIEGHVPIRGISLPGMPLGAPGMDGPKEGPFVIYEITDGEKRVYSTE